MFKREYRTFTGELRAKGDNKMGASGYAAVFNQTAVIGGWYREVIKPGAFSRALKEHQDVRALQNHDENLVLGRTKSKTLTLSEDEKGLSFEVDFPETQYARDLHAVLDRGDVDQCSFGFYVRKQSWREEKTPDGKDILTREIEDVDLFDVSIVTYPAYEGTSAEARSLWPEGMPEEVEQHTKSANSRAMTDCMCDCKECKAGKCADCSHDECDCEGCTCDQKMEMQKNAADRTRMEMRLRLAEAAQ